MFMAPFVTYTPSGLNVVASALLPLAVLSGGSWYMKKRFQQLVHDDSEAPNEQNDERKEDEVQLPALN